MTGMLFFLAKTDRLDLKLPKSLICTEISLVVLEGNNERHVKQQFRKNSFFRFMWNLIIKIIYTSYLCKVFESLTKKFESFQRFKNFEHFRVFILSNTVNSKRRKQRKN